MVLKIILAYLLIVNSAFPQVGGGAPVQDQGTSNYQIQTTDPTATPDTSHKYLYNKNTQFKTKDSTGRLSRAFFNPDNLLQRNNNSDAEEGLTTDFTYTAATTVLNTTAPLSGLNSLDFNPTNSGEFLDTAFITLPRGLYGQTCMAQFTYIGGDANLSGYVYNRDNEIVGQIALSAVTNSTTITIPFTCPTQANITADPDKADVKIRIAQSTATNAAIATVDDFYVGILNTNKIGVQGQPEIYEANSLYTGVVSGAWSRWLNITANTINSLATIVNGVGTDFLYTAKKPSVVTFSVSYQTVSSSVNLPCFSKNGSFCVNTGIGATLTAAGVFSTISYYLQAGDTVKIGASNTGNATTTGTSNTLYVVATPIPQIATVLDTGVPPAGFLGKVIYSNAGCSWTNSTTAMDGFAPIPACSTGVTREGFAIADTATPGQLPSITLSKLPSTRIKVIAYGMFQRPTVAGYNCQYGLALNGMYVANQKNTSGGTTAGTDTPNAIWEFKNNTELSNAKLEIFSGSSNINACNIVADGINSQLAIVVSNEPDNSTPYALNQQIAVLPPQVTNSSAKNWRTESCYITNNGTAAMASTSCNTWVQSVSRTALGEISVNMISDKFTTPPQCLCTSGYPVATALMVCSIKSMSNVTTSLVSTLTRNQAGASEDAPININCQGFTN
jgi:hypothetical protein